MQIQKFQEWFWRAYVLDRPAFIASAEEFFKKESQIEGWSAPPVMGILNFITSQCLDKNESYLEIGVYAGRSFTSALKGNTVHGYAIDNFWDSETLLSSFQDNIKSFGVHERCGLFHGDSMQFDINLPKIGLMFYDGNHDRGHTIENLNHFEKYLSDQAIVIVDDIEIEAGLGHSCYPGYDMVSNMPVLDDLIQWLREHPKCELFMLTPWTFKQAILIYRR
jgi:predicted O-methyltransferase YrrM